jgi:hypothetical protein
VLALCIASGTTIGQAASMAGISRRSAQRRQADPVFVAQVHRIRARMLSRAAGKLAKLSSKAVDGLEKLIDDPAAPSAVRLGAQRAALEFANRSHEMTALADQLKDLQEKMEALGHA